MTALPLPLAPRPHDGEAVSSWVERLAARYDLTGDELVLCLLGKRSVAGHRAERLDHCADAQLEGALAAAARIDRSRLSGLRVVSADGSASCWHRKVVAWCPACIREDVARCGEVHRRAIWRLGSCVLCPVHCLELQDMCCRCVAGARCHFRSAGGRVRLACAVCGRLVDAVVAATSVAVCGRAGAFGIPRTPEILRLVRVMQEDLGAALAGLVPGRSWGPARGARVLLAATRALTLSLIQAAGIRIEPRIDVFALASGQVRSPVCEPITLAALTPYAAFGVMAVVASVLDSLAGGQHAGRCWRPADKLAPMDAASVLAWLPKRERSALDAAAASMGGATGHALQMAIAAVGTITAV